MTPLEAGSPAEAAAWLAVHGSACWQQADGAALAAACAAVPDAELADWPDVARWRALAALLADGADAMPCLELAHAGHLAAGDAAAARLDAHLALALCLADIGAMEGVDTWVRRSQADEPAPAPAPKPEPEPALLSVSVSVPVPMPVPPGPAFDTLWLALGEAARAVLSPEHGQGAGLALARLHQHLAPLGAPLAAHERLLVAQVLVNAHFARQQFEQFDRLQSVVEAPAVFPLAPPLMRARWHHTLGFACYQVGRWAAAESAWQQALTLAQAHGLAHQGLMATLAMLRLLLDRQRLAEAAALEAAIDPRWGAGRPMQLMWLQQMRARLALLQGQSTRAQAWLGDALALADEAGLSQAERGALHTDRVQLLLALGQEAEAQALLARLSGPAGGAGPNHPAATRDNAVFQCLHDLVQAQALAGAGDKRAPAMLQQALRQAQALRYTMFFRLLPPRAAEICALALRYGVETVFVLQVIQDRRLPAPPAAGPAWPWALWFRMLGGFELRLRGQPLPRQTKPQAKPLELLRYLACTPEGAAPMRLLADALWPDSEGAAAHKSLEMTVQRARRLLADDGLLQVQEGVLSLDTAQTSSDLQQRSQITRALQSLGMQPGLDALADLRQAQALLQTLRASGRDPAAMLLPGAPDTPWLLAARQEAAAELQRAVRAGAAVLARARAAAAAAGAAAGRAAAFGAAVDDAAAIDDAQAFALGLAALQADPAAAPVPTGRLPASPGRA